MDRPVKAFFTGSKHGSDIENIAEMCNVSSENIFFPVQRHTDIVMIVESSCGPEVADAVVTKRKGLLIGVRVADCVPILLFDPENLVVGAVHAGWRGTSNRILAKTVRTMSERFSTRPDNIRIAIGPSIRQCCYEVDSEVYNAVTGTLSRRLSYRKKGDKYFPDLSSINLGQAMEAGVIKENAWISDECTCCSHDKFHSYRFSKDSAGRQAGFIGLF